MTQRKAPNFGWEEGCNRALEDDNVEYFKLITNQTGGLWRGLKSNSGNTLLQEAICRRRWNVFEYLLKFCDEKYLETLNNKNETAITLALEVEKSCEDKNYVLALVKKYHKIPRSYDGILLHYSIEIGNFRLFEQLLKKGIDCNARAGVLGPTPLHKVMSVADLYSFTYVSISLLLVYGANPFLKFQKCYPFEWAVLHSKSFNLHTLLFNYTFDKLESYQLHFRVLSTLAAYNSPVFNRIIQYDNIGFFIEGEDIITSIVHLLKMDIEYLKIILKKYYRLVCNIFDDFRGIDVFFHYMICDMADPTFLERLFTFLESGNSLKHEIIDIMSKLSKRDLLYTNRLEKSKATEVVIFMMQYGATINEVIINWVYQEYGDGDLFRFLLHIDCEKSTVNQPKIIMVSLICDIHIDLNFVCRQEPTFYSHYKLLDILDFCAHRKLTQFLLNKIRYEYLQLPQEQFERLRNHPEIPTLTELARNVFRKYLVQRYRIKSAKRFYSLVRNLNISSTYKEIICFQRKLYKPRDL